jgi:subtilase family serine protease
VLAETPVSETEGVTGFPEIVTAENYLIDNHLVDVITQSFGATEQTFPSKQSLLNLRSAILNAYHHNVSVLASTGDTGAANYQLNLTDLYTHPVVGWPATDPLVTAVGGTQLHLNQQGRRTAPDNAWNDTVLFGFPTAGGGGLSTIFSRPDYQDSVANVVDGHRGIPDISMSAACNGAVEYFHTYGGATPGWHIVCGTSEASPLFSGVVAIADQAAGHDLGLLNPRLYALGTASAGIVDVTRGSITVTFTQNGSTFTVGGPRFNAKPGYDLATGLGTVDATRLVAELAR